MFEIEESPKPPLNADIRVVGVGGGGGNAVETMIKEGIRGVKFITVNTDAQALSAGAAETKIQLGAKLTKGLGAGANPEIGRRAAIESYEEIITHLKGADMVFITAGMGGGTGTGGIPVIAEAAREQGALTVGVVTTPFLFEGNKRKKRAEKGIAELKSHLDTLIIIPNEKLLTVFDDDTPLLETFKKTDEVLLKAVKGLAELISLKGLINLDFADVRTVMTDKGMALMGMGTAGGKNRAKRAVTEAVSSPLLNSSAISGATGIIVNITAGAGLSLREINEISSLLTKSADPEADIIVGAVIDENMADRISVTLIATGFDEAKTLKSVSLQTPPAETRPPSSLTKEKTREPKGLSLVPSPGGKTIPLPPAAHKPEKPPIALLDPDGDPSPEEAVEGFAEKEQGALPEKDSPGAEETLKIKTSNENKEDNTDSIINLQTKKPTATLHIPPPKNPEPDSSNNETALSLKEREEDATKNALPEKNSKKENSSVAEETLKIKTSNENRENIPDSIINLQTKKPAATLHIPPPKNPEPDSSNNETALSLKEREEDAAMDALPEKNSKKEKDSPPSVREILLKKAKEHALRRETVDKDREKPSAFPQQQMSLSWPKEDLGEDSAGALSPFESDLSFSEEDLL